MLKNNGKSLQDLSLSSVLFACTIPLMNQSAEAKALQAGYAQARAITKQWAKTFYFASLFLPRDKQRAAYAVYALCRISDDAVDATNHAQRSRALSCINGNIGRAYGKDALTDPLLIAFRETITRYRIPQNYFDELIQGVRADLVKNRYQNFEELREYCYRVAGVVGLVMLRIFGYSLEAERFAVDLGIAMQLTNIIRDIKEDFDRGRIYLPLDELNRFGVTEEKIAKRIISASFIELMRFQIQRARGFYAAAAPGIALIPDTRSRFVAAAMKNIYGAILDAAEKNGYDIFSGRAHVNLWGRIGLILKMILHGQKR